MKEYNDITYIIVTWNNNDTIIECLDSIYKYSSNFKIIIVDNDSKDNTVEIVKNKKYKNCEIIDTKSNNGFAKGNNIALEFVKTKYICYLNPDTILIEDIASPSIEILNKNLNIGIVGCKLLYKDYKNQASVFNFETPFQIFLETMRFGIIFPNFIREKYFPNVSKNKTSKIVDWVIGAEMILLTEDAMKINGFSEDYFMYTEDMDICKKMKDFNNKETYFNSENALIHIGGVSESKNVNYNKIERMITNKYIFIRKFYTNKKALNALKMLQYTYLIKKTFVFLFMHKKNRKNILEKMKQSQKIAKKIYMEKKNA